MSWLNHRTLVLHPDCESLRDFMLSVPERFDRGEGTVIHKGRNELSENEVRRAGVCGEIFSSP